MKNKILLGISISLIILVVAVRYLFKENFEMFKLSISKYEAGQLDNFRIKKEKKIASLSSGDKNIYQLFTEQFDENKSITIRDTTYSFLYLSESVQYKTASLQYIDCLNIKCVIDAQNKAAQKLIERTEKELEMKFGETFLIWYPKLKGKILLKSTNNSEKCSNFFPGLKEISFNKNVWDDFEKLMSSYNSELKSISTKNKNNETQCLKKITSTKRQLNSNAITYFENKLTSKKSEFLKTTSETRTYNSPYLGIITYDVTLTKFNKEAFQIIVDEAYKEQWKYNSLKTGAMPYSNCFGSSNYCGGWGCSNIKVFTGGDGDVLVTIKNYSGKVVRHAYIKGGNSFTFNVPDGKYQTFFYSGKGWNPKKVMSSSSCNYLQGGFVSNESVTKDNYIQLNNQIMTYELILQLNGNFNTKPSSKSEAF